MEDLGENREREQHYRIAAEYFISLAAAFGCREVWAMTSATDLWLQNHCLISLYDLRLRSYTSAE